MMRIKNRSNAPFYEITHSRIRINGVGARLITEESINEDIFNELHKNISKYSIEEDFLDEDVVEGEITKLNTNWEYVIKTFFRIFIIFITCRVNS